MVFPEYASEIPPFTFSTKVPRLTSCQTRTAVSTALRVADSAAEPTLSIPDLKLLSIDDSDIMYVD